MSNFLAPRINAWYEQKYRDGLVYKKTLRILLEIEIYVQRNLKHPSIAYLSESMLPKLRELGYVDDEQAASLSETFPQFLRVLQPQVVQEILPDRSEELHQEFTSILRELSTVDPLLAYQISERHTISPFQRMNNFLNLIRSTGFEVKEEDKEFQLVNRFMQAQKAKLIDELLGDLRKDILKVAARTGKKGLKEIELHFRKQDIKRREHAQNLVGEFAKIMPKKPQDSKEESKNDSEKESVHSATQI